MLWYVIFFYLYICIGIEWSFELASDGYGDGDVIILVVYF